MVLETLYKPLVDNMTTAVLVVDAKLRVCHLNPAAEMLLAVSLQRVLGEAIEALLEQPASAAQALHQAASGINNTSEQHDRYTQRQTPWRLHDGSRITVDYSVTPIEEQNLLLIEVQPIDRIMRISHEKSLIAAQETSRQLIRGMAHEVKNPLGGIRGAAQLLQRELDQVAPSSNLGEYTNIIVDEVDRLRNLVDRMLGPSTLPVRKWLNIHQVLERVASVIGAECSGRIAIVRDYDPSIPELNADAEQLIQAALNIARNAMQALTESATANANITLRSRIQRHFTIGGQHHPLVCRLDIIDNGPGIDASIFDDIFYPMISGRAEGSGLGLSIAQHLIQQHQGLIRCDSQPGRTCFSIYLPFKSRASQTDSNHNKVPQSTDKTHLGQ